MPNENIYENILRTTISKMRYERLLEVENNWFDTYIAFNIDTDD